jgi:hypothetical protein
LYQLGALFALVNADILDDFSHQLHATQLCSFWVIQQKGRHLLINAGQYCQEKQSLDVVDSIIFQEHLYDISIPSQKK